MALIATGKNSLMNAKITECNSEEQQNICIALKYLLPNIYYYGHFNLYPQIL